MMNLVKYFPATDKLAHAAIGLMAAFLVMPFAGVVPAAVFAWALGFGKEELDARANEAAEAAGEPLPAHAENADIVWTGTPATIFAGWAAYWWNVPIFPMWFL